MPSSGKALYIYIPTIEIDLIDTSSQTVSVGEFSVLDEIQEIYYHFLFRQSLSPKKALHTHWSHTCVGILDVGPLESPMTISLHVSGSRANCGNFVEKAEKSEMITP